MNQGLSFFKPDLLEPGTTTATFSWAYTACNCEQFARIMKTDPLGSFTQTQHVSSKLVSMMSKWLGSSLFQYP